MVVVPVAEVAGADNVGDAATPAPAKVDRPPRGGAMVVDPNSEPAR